MNKLVIPIIFAAVLLFPTACEVFGVSTDTIGEDVKNLVKLNEGVYNDPGGRWALTFEKGWLLGESTDISSAFVYPKQVTEEITEDNFEALTYMTVKYEAVKTSNLMAEIENWRRSAVANVGEGNVGEITVFQSAGGAGYQFGYAAVSGFISRLILLSGARGELYSVIVDDVADPFVGPPQDVLSTFAFTGG